jgi:glutamate 5-kinase
MPDQLRQDVADVASLLVVKVGTRVLTGADGLLDPHRIEALGRQFDSLLASGRSVVLVSSGAVGAGMGRMGLSSRPQELANLQAVAAIGQSCLIEAYERVFRSRGRHAAQVLLVADDLQDRARYLNIRNTLRALLDYGAIPVINENDTVSVEELRTSFGDNVLSLPVLTAVWLIVRAGRSPQRWMENVIAGIGVAAPFAAMMPALDGVL